MAFTLIAVFLLFGFSFSPQEKGWLNVSNTSLIKRQNQWPNWARPLLIKNSQLNEPLIYPSWFQGSWEVESINLVNPDEIPVKHLARFQLQNQNRVLADRSFNTKSLGEATLKENFIGVKDDPNNPNRQIAFFDEERSLETKIISRGEEYPSHDVFISDEVSMQIFHSSSISRISKVETLSQYQLCKANQINSPTFSEVTICGEQWQVNFPLPGDTISPLKNQNSHYFLYLKHLPD